MFDTNSMMRAQLAQAQQQMLAEIREDEAKKAAAAAAEQRRQQEIAAQEAARVAAEAEKARQEAEQKRLALEEEQRIVLLINNAEKESRGLLSGIANIQSVFLEKEDTVAKFSITEPLENALIANKIEAVSFLLSKGQRYEAWRDIVTVGTELHALLSSHVDTTNKPKHKIN